MGLNELIIYHWWLAQSRGDMRTIAEFELSAADIASIIDGLGRRPTREEWDQAGHAYAYDVAP
jgi:hypothetical protein